MGWHHWIPVSSTESYRLGRVSENVTLAPVSWCVAKFLALRCQIREDGALWFLETENLWIEKQLLGAHTEWTLKAMGLWQCPFQVPNHFSTRV
jgi:hypothetical protein